MTLITLDIFKRLPLHARYAVLEKYSIGDVCPLSWGEYADELMERVHEESREIYPGDGQTILSLEIEREPNEWLYVCEDAVIIDLYDEVPDVSFCAQPVVVYSDGDKVGEFYPPEIVSWHIDWLCNQMATKWYVDIQSYKTESYYRW